LCDGVSILCIFFFQRYGPHRDLHSFPTRRSSDLGAADAMHVRIPAEEEVAEPIVLQIDGVGGRADAHLVIEAERHSVATITRCRSEEHTSELQSRENLVCRLLLEKKKQKKNRHQQ